MDNIILSFVVSNDDKKGILPKNIQLWIGPEEDDLNYLGNMSTVEDNHYLGFGTTVYGINLRKFNSQSLDDYIENLNQITPVHYIKFVIEKPQPVSI